MKSVLPMIGIRLGQILFAAVVISTAATRMCAGQDGAATAQLALDSDRDGMSDALEQALLEQFAPTLSIANEDCANAPAEFRRGSVTPEAQAENGTLYGQVFPVKHSAGDAPAAEIHYYHLWKSDCGSRGHALDTEHVSVLVRASENGLSSAQWKAEYWYAAAHEDTVCDVSQIARASTLGAEHGGARVWVSRGKHASYLDPVLCREGCGADRCEDMVALPRGQLVNLGEPEHPMNGSAFIASAAWPLAPKMRGSNFPAEALARVNQLPETEIAWFRAGSHPSQGVIAVSGTTAQAIGTGGEATAMGLSMANAASGNAISTAKGSTGNALAKSYRNTKHALGTSVRHVGKALHVGGKPETPKAADNGK